jgi:molybdopterin molybdotransferase
MDVDDQPALSVESARGKMVGAVRPLGNEEVSLAAALNRTLAGPVIATRSHPPFRSSAMDGYAVRSADAPGTRLQIAGEAAAGLAYPGTLEPGQAVRIFTGAPVPSGADAVIPQERVRREGREILIDEASPPGRNIRERAIDFSAKAELVPSGAVLGPGHLALAAATGLAALNVRRAPRVAVLSTGSEIAAPGAAAGPDQIFDSVSFGLGAMIERWGGTPVRHAALPDIAETVSHALPGIIADADLTVIVGGASVGDYDIVKKALASLGLDISVPKVAVRPGKPTWFGMVGGTPLLGLPGNPTAAFVCAFLFLRPLIHGLLARSDKPAALRAVLDGQIDKSGENEIYLRARLSVRDDARFAVRPFENQDTSLVSVFAAANALVRRPPQSGPAVSGDLVEVLPLDAAMG